MGTPQRHLAVVLASAGRPAILHETVASLLRQRLLPGEIVLSVPEGDHVLPETLQIAGVTLVRGAIGLTRQRNAAVAALGEAVEVVTFLDDDVELDAGYLAAIVRAFRKHPDVVFVGGRVVADGPGDGVHSRRDARRLLAVDALRHAGRDRRLDLTPITCRDAYGCNMSVRRSVFGSVEFDARLPLYGLMEDLDFAQQCSRLGRLARCETARMVHLFVPSGRLPGARLGYAQIANPLYLWAKGNVPSGYLVRELARHLAANALKMLLPEQSADRRARLAGNLMAIRSVLRGRIAPEDMLLIPPSDVAPARAAVSPASDDRASPLFRRPLEEE